jgi:hypothetical protein
MAECVLSREPELRPARREEGAVGGGDPQGKDHAPRPVRDGLEPA